MIPVSGLMLTVALVAGAAGPAFAQSPAYIGQVDSSARRSASPSTSEQAILSASSRPDGGVTATSQATPLAGFVESGFVGTSTGITGGAMTNAQTNNLAVLNQFGSGNLGTINQMGSGNRAEALVTGNNNVSTQDQVGTGNISALNINGNNNRSVNLGQSGNGNSINYSINGDDNAVSFKQNGDNLSFQFQQIGSGPNITVTQEGQGKSRSGFSINQTNATAVVSKK